MRRARLLGMMGGVALVTTALLAEVVFANIGAGSAKVPLTDFLIELYHVTNNIYVPLICLAAVAFGAANLLFGFMRFGPVIGRVFGVIGLLGLGVTWVGQTIGASVAISLIV